MRKFIIFNVITILSLCIITFSPSVIKVTADSEYRRIITSDTPFYSDGTGTELLFYLPYTYYVKVIEYGQILSHVECYGGEKSIALDGYVPTSMLYQDNLSVISPYLKKHIMTATTTVLYSDKGLSTPIQYVFSSRELVYYGQLTNFDNSIIFFVSYNNKLGYVSENSIVPFEIENHPNQLTPPCSPCEWLLLYA